MFGIRLSINHNGDWIKAVALIKEEFAEIDENNACHKNSSWPLTDVKNQKQIKGESARHMFSNIAKEEMEQPIVPISRCIFKQI